MAIVRMLQPALESPAANRGGRTLRRLPIFLLVVVALALAGCGKQVSPYWPDLSVVPGTSVSPEGTVYVAEANGQVFALKADTGAVLWSYPVVQQSSGGLLGGCSAQAPSDGPFYSAPASKGEELFLASSGDQTRTLFSRGENRAGLRVLNNQGQLQWAFRGATGPSVSSPALDQSTVYLPSSDFNVYAIDIESHNSRWVFETKGWVWATPLVVEDRVYIASMDHNLYAVQAENGDEIWRFAQSNTALPATPAFANGVLYVGSLGGQVYAVDAGSGNVLWNQKVDGGVWATPAIQEQRLYFGTLNGQVYALDATNGQQIWAKSVGSEVRGSPAYVDGTIYLTSEAGQLYAFDAASGDLTQTLLGQQAKPASIFTGPVYDGHRLYVVATSGEVSAIDPTSNQVVWQVNPLAKD